MTKNRLFRRIPVFLAISVRITYLLFYSYPERRIFKTYYILLRFFKRVPSSIAFLLRFIPRGNLSSSLTTDDYY